MTIVVTGAAGFIGRHTVAALCTDGHRVVAIDRREAPLPHGAEAITADLLSGDDRIGTALTEADAVVHLAGRPGVRDHGPDPDAARHRDNVLAGAFVCAATPPRTPMLIASSSSVYGGADTVRGRAVPCHEEQRLRPRGAYARSKVALEQIAARRAAGGGHVAVFRPFTVAGEGQRPDMALSTWIDQARRGQPMTVLGSLDRRRDVTDVRDIAHGIRRLLETGHRMTVNLGTGTTFTLRQLTHAVATTLGAPHLTSTSQADPVEVPVTRADTRRCAAMLGFTPSTDLADLVRRQVSTTTTTTAIPLEVS